MKKKWVAYNKSYEFTEQLKSHFNISEMLARTLINRGLDNIEKVKRFMDADIHDMYDPFLMTDMDKAVERILQAIEENEKICIYGDYDVDGITSTALCVNTLRKLEADVMYYIPVRAEEGYGLNDEAIAHIAEQGANLIVTVDCGIRSIDTVETVKKSGMDIIITDHHECGDILPDAYAIVNPHRHDCSYPFKELAGVGVAFKLMQAVTESIGYSELLFEVIDIAAIGTIADVVPLLDENRIIVKKGLEKLMNTENVGLKALIDMSDLKDKQISSYNIAFIIAPRINAAGRLADASRCVELLITEDEALAYEIAKELETENKERQRIEAEILEQAIAKLTSTKDFENSRIIVLDEQNWHAGVIGIVASRIVEQFNKPSILIARDHETGKGSARSMSGFNLYEAMCKCSELFEKFGGHEMAAGLTIKAEYIGAFRKKINEVAEEMLLGKELLPELLVDYKLEPADISLQVAKQLKNLEPFGMGNPNPNFVCRNMQILDRKLVGTSSKHLSLNLYDGNNNIKAIAFNMGNLYNVLSIGKKIDIICCMDINLWNNNENVQLVIKDIKLIKN
ncbi:MAG: exonuclease RecJ [Clostridia bacterium]|nr:exonuclease RecJ [Clostridia bacterium]